MARLYFKHAHLIIDSTREYLDASIIINNEIIKEVYPFSNKVKEDYKEYKEVDVNGYYIFPMFVELDEYHSRYQIKDNLNNIDKYKRLFLTGNISRDEVKNVEYELIYDLYNNMVFDVKRQGLIEEAFYTNKYVSININKLNDEQLKLAIRNIDVEKLIIQGFDANTCSRLHNLKVSNTDIYRYLTGNVLRLFYDDKLKGTLIKGRRSDLVILNKDYKAIAIIKDGELINA